MVAQWTVIRYATHAYGFRTATSKRSVSSSSSSSESIITNALFDLGLSLLFFGCGIPCRNYQWSRCKLLYVVTVLRVYTYLSVKDPIDCFFDTLCKLQIGYDISTASGTIDSKNFISRFLEIHGGSFEKVVKLKMQNQIPAVAAESELVDFNFLSGQSIQMW